MTIPGESRTDRPQATASTQARSLVTSARRAALLLASILVLLVLPSAASAAVTFDRTDYAVGAGPSSVATGDFNGDGKRDLVTANGNSDNVSVLLGDGSGGYGAPTTFPVGTGPISVAVGDFNGDGHPDLVTANELQQRLGAARRRRGRLWGPDHPPGRPGGRAELLLSLARAGLS